MPHKLFGIGDVHGCYDLLIKALDWIEAQAPDGAEVVFVGDIVDRGPKSREVVELLMRGPRRLQDVWQPIMGNHEVMMLLAFDDRRMWDVHHWLINGGEATLASYEKTNAKGPVDFKAVPAAHIEWIRSLPVFHETKNHWFVHAGLYPDTNPRNEDREVLLWSRKWWDAGYGSYERHVVFGHTPFRQGPLLLPHCTGLDTGACFGYALTVAEFDRNSASGPIRTMSIDAKSGLMTGWEHGS